MDSGRSWPWVAPEAREQAEAIASYGREGRHPLRYATRDGIRLDVVVELRTVAEPLGERLGFLMTARPADGRVDRPDVGGAVERIAAAVSQRRPAIEVLELVSREAAVLCAGDMGAVLRFESAGEAIVITAVGRGTEAVHGRRIALPPGGANVRVAATGQPAHSTRTAVVRPALSDQGIEVHESAAVPIHVDGRPWGTLAVARTHDRRLRASARGILERLAPFASAAAAGLEGDAPAQLDRAHAVGSLTRMVRVSEERYSWADGHSCRVAQVATAIARKLDWSTPAVAQLEEAAQLHDVGMLSLPDGVVCQAGPLSADERALVDRHPDIGARLVSDLLQVEQARWIRAHHERFDGAGYPDRLAAGAIPEGAAILAAAELWDALTRPRPHRSALDRDRAREEVRRAHGGQLAPAAAAALLAVDPPTPPPAPAIDWPAGLALTARQIEILRLLDAGAGTDEIAARLHLTRTTVRNHVARLLRRLDVHSRVEALARARSLGLLG